MGGRRDARLVHRECVGAHLPNVKHVVALIATDGILPVSLRIKGVDCVNREEDSSNLPKHHISVL